MIVVQKSSMGNLEFLKSIFRIYLDIYGDLDTFCSHLVMKVNFTISIFILLHMSARDRYLRTKMTLAIIKYLNSPNWVCVCADLMCLYRFVVTCTLQPATMMLEIFRYDFTMSAIFLKSNMPIFIVPVTITALEPNRTGVDTWQLALSNWPEKHSVVPP